MPRSPMPRSRSMPRSRHPMPAIITSCRSASGRDAGVAMAVVDAAATVGRAAPGWSTSSSSPASTPTSRSTAATRSRGRCSGIAARRPAHDPAILDPEDRRRPRHADDRDRRWRSHRRDPALAREVAQRRLLVDDVEPALVILLPTVPIAISGSCVKNNRPPRATRSPSSVAFSSISSSGYRS